MEQADMIKNNLISNNQDLNPPSKNLLLLIFGIVVLSVFVIYLFLSLRKENLIPITQHITSPTTPTVIRENPTIVPTEKVDEIKDWKTYTNIEYGFSFKHPNLEIILCNKIPHGCGLGLGGNNHLFNEILLAKYKLPLSYYPSSFGILVTKSSVQDSFDNFVKNEEKTLFQSLVEYHNSIKGGKTSEQLRENLKYRKITISGTKGYVLEGYTIEEGPWRRYYFPLKNNKILAITENDNNFNQILSTFKFLNEK